MKDEISIQKSLGDLKKLAPSGYALAFHIAFTTPTFLFQTYPKAWIKQYSQKGFVMSDPTVHWGFENEGTIRWSALAADDTEDVLTQAATHGLAYGLTCAVNIGGTRSFAGFARADREFSDAEAGTLIKAVGKLHVETAEIKTLSPETTLALQQMSVDFTPASV